SEILAAVEPAAAVDFARSRLADIAIVDVPDRTTLPIVEALGASGMIVVATSGAGSVALAVEAMRRGAVDFVLKPYSPETLARRLAPRLEERRQRAEDPAEAGPDPDEPRDFAGFVGRSAPMQALYGEIARIAPSRAPVFITGESGSGKELCAEAIHARSGRAAKPLVALNCGAIPRELMESEVFGHVRGAFTGATDDRVGAVE
ncbi:sigma-54-dependent transcriptional regulator, partial [Hansschlegelia beijingensis]